MGGDGPASLFEQLFLGVSNNGTISFGKEVGMLFRFTHMI